jgi:raffinose synthase
MSEKGTARRRGKHETPTQFVWRVNLERDCMKGVPGEAVVEFDFESKVYTVGLPAGAVRSGSCGGIGMVNLRRFLALDRPALYWTRPKVGHGKRREKVFPELKETQLFLWEQEEECAGFAAMMPLVSEGVRAYLRGDPADERSLELVWEVDEGFEAKETTPVLMVATGGGAPEVIERLMEAAYLELRSFRTPERKGAVRPGTLGWCTWNAFYKDVSEEKVLAGLRSFREAGVPLGWCILDDGWLQTDEKEQLLDFRADPVKFPRGLKPVIDVARSEGLLRPRGFAVWHAFQGYWGGVSETGELGKRYRVVKNRGDIRPWKPGTEIELSLVHPEDVGRFYGEWYEYLRREGVFGVKVDGQSATEMFTRGVLPRVGTMRKMQYAMQAAGMLHFKGTLIHCMAHGSDVVMNMLGTWLWRNSDDFFPDRPESHGAHVRENALTALWSHTFGVPDWDMFWSGHAQGAFHAAARVVAASPVYVSDRPGEQDGELLRRLMDDAGDILTTSRVALPSRRSVFYDAKGKELLLINSVVAEGMRLHGIVGVFHCAETEEELSVVVGPGDVREFEEELQTEVIAYSHVTGAVEVMDEEMGMEVKLGRLGWDIVTFAPVAYLSGVAALGVLEKMVGAAALGEELDSEEEYRVVVKCGGTSGFVSPNKPREVRLMDGFGKEKEAAFEWDEKKGLVKVEVPVGGAVVRVMVE